MLKVIGCILLVVVCVFLQSSCTDEREAQRILEAQGYENIEFTGYSWFSCSEKDTYATGFKATGVNGKPIAGAVCSGMFFKNSTIRFE
ncbi:hypothetical protein AVU18_gp046 [Citrobacter phage IME-CF2]|uniref:Uncharacterized protein n=1 Tax=Citrobacter phage IME-CF2 TaxID=1673887 RepID=A0A0K0QS02_9CAUD|nr:hypothetical protein AVU18_gp046 [Citrobacter phage IME-CF2]AKR15892.1 hypothetical protein [Citrobacter phage IME-CF2]